MPHNRRRSVALGWEAIPSRAPGPGRHSIIECRHSKSHSDMMGDVVLSPIAGQQDDDCSREAASTARLAALLGAQAKRLCPA